MSGVNKRTQQDILNEEFLQDVMALMENGLFPTPEEALKMQSEDEGDEDQN